MPRFRPELGLEDRPELREELLRRAARRSVPEVDRMPILSQVDFTLQTCVWKVEPPSELDIRKKAFRTLARRIIDCFRARRRRGEQGPEEPADPVPWDRSTIGRSDLGILDQMVAEEDAEKAAAELRERLKEYERCVTWVTGKERRWYAGPTGHARRAYDIRLFELRQEYPVVSLRSLGRLLKAYYAKHLPNAPGSGCVPYCRRSEAMACERMGILLIRMAEYRRGER